MIKEALKFAATALPDSIEGGVLKAIDHIDSALEKSSEVKDRGRWERFKVFCLALYDEYSSEGEKEDEVKSEAQKKAKAQVDKMEGKYVRVEGGDTEAQEEIVGDGTIRSEARASFVASFGIQKGIPDSKEVLIECSNPKLADCLNKIRSGEKIDSGSLVKYSGCVFQFVSDISKNSNKSPKNYEQLLGDIKILMENGIAEGLDLKSLFSPFLDFKKDRSVAMDFLGKLDFGLSEMSTIKDCTDDLKKFKDKPKILKKLFPGTGLSDQIKMVDVMIDLNKDGFKPEYAAKLIWLGRNSWSRLAEKLS